MKCCDCKNKIDNCSCSIIECNCNEIINCLCCLFKFWEERDKQLSIHETFINFWKETIKIKAIPSVIKKDIESSFKKLSKVENCLNKLNKANYIKYLDLKYDPEYIAKLMQKNNMSKLSYFITKLESYIEFSNILIDVSEYLNSKNIYLKLNVNINEIVKLLPIIVEIFVCFEPSIENSLEYETLKEKMYIFDSNLINLENKLEIKITL
ncbi:hypothetical protein [Spiroplasma endosymbiont of Cantharis nigra]|uniref:hypothetical protein n=1 Tax=Spiroplasma endosymbiont of Cantharis nigra TaxID=3066278 RepID=UPI0030D30F21